MLSWKSGILIGQSILNFLNDLRKQGIFHHKSYMYSHPKIFVTRLKPHADLRESILDFARSNKIKAGVVLTCVGSLEQLNLRFANQPSGSLLRGYFEILSLSGTFSDTSSHLHLSVADHTGKTIGGHLLTGNLIYTAEIAFAELTDLEFHRVLDPTYGYRELIVHERK
jgi:predicted DNA-binding protein with PD1-like motif